MKVKGCPSLCDKRMEICASLCDKRMEICPFLCDKGMEICASLYGKEMKICTSFYGKGMKKGATFCNTKMKCYSSLCNMEMNTVAIIAAKPINSEISNFVLRRREESTVAVTGSMQAIKVALTGPISFAPCKNSGKLTAVPITTITTIMEIDIKSKLLGSIQTLVTIPNTIPPINIPQPETKIFPNFLIRFRDKSVYDTTPKAETIPQKSPGVEITILDMLPFVAIRYVPKTARNIAKI